MNGYAYLIVFAAIVLVCEASDCCNSYTDPTTGEYVDGKVCNDYCCLFTSKGIYECCDDFSKQAPVSMRDADCSNWVKEHMFLTIVVIILALVVLGTLCTCCCCCCCACCRKGKSQTVIVTGAGQPSSVVVASHQQHQMSPPTNPAHYGYDQK